MPPETTEDGVWLCGMILVVKDDAGEIAHKMSFSGIPSLVYRYLGECMKHAIGCDCEECRKVSDACMKLNLGEMTREEATRKAQGVWVADAPETNITLH